MDMYYIHLSMCLACSTNKISDHKLKVATGMHGCYSIITYMVFSLICIHLF